MGLLDVLNGMQQGPRGPSTPSQQSSGGMSPMTMAILGLLAFKAIKHLTGSQPGASPKPSQPSAPSPKTVTAGAPGGETGGLSDLLKGGLGGLLAGGWTSWNAEGHPIAALERLPVEEIGERLDATPPAQVLDVREVAEFESGYIPGSVNVPWHDIDGIPAGIDPARQVLVMCASGQRAGTGASLLQRFGATVLNASYGINR